MKTLSGFTIVRNARRLGYPIVESIRSILPIVDEYVVLVAASEDDTRDLVASVGDPKVRIIDTDWDMSTDRGARLLADKTNEALDLCEGIWCFYLQADEVVRVRADIERILSRHTGQEVATLRADTDHDRVFTAAAAREYGLIDQVIEERAPLA